MDGSIYILFLVYVLRHHSCRVLQDYDALQDHLGPKAANLEVTKALQAMNLRLQQISLDTIPRDEVMEWLNRKADR